MNRNTKERENIGIHCTTGISIAFCALGGLLAAIYLNRTQIGSWNPFLYSILQRSYSFFQKTSAKVIGPVFSSPFLVIGINIILKFNKGIYKDKEDERRIIRSVWHYLSKRHTILFCLGGFVCAIDLTCLVNWGNNPEIITLCFLSSLFLYIDYLIFYFNPVYLEDRLFYLSQYILMVPGSESNEFYYMWQGMMKQAVSDGHRFLNSSTWEICYQVLKNAAKTRFKNQDNKLCDILFFNPFIDSIDDKKQLEKIWPILFCCGIIDRYDFMIVHGYTEKLIQMEVDVTHLSGVEQLNTKLNNHKGVYTHVFIIMYYVVLMGMYSKTISNELYSAYYDYLRKYIRNHSLVMSPDEVSIQMKSYFFEIQKERPFHNQELINPEYIFSLISEQKRR